MAGKPIYNRAGTEIIGYEGEQSKDYIDPNKRGYKDPRESGPADRGAGAPKREDFPDGLAGQAAYTKAVREWEAKQREKAPPRKGASLRLGGGGDEESNVAALLRDLWSRRA